MNYYVYIYYDPRKTPAEPIYVGKGHGDRYKHHITKGAKNKHLANKLKKIDQAKLDPVIEFASTNMSPEDASSLEIELIAKFGRANKKEGTLCNFTDGGEGTPGYKHSEKTKQLFSEQRKGKKQTPAQYDANCNRDPISDETREKMSKANKGHSRHTPEQIEIIKAYNQTREITDSMRTKWSETRLGNTPTKANYPPLDELATMIENSSRNQVAKQLGVTYNSLTKYLQRRGVTLKDARFSRAS